MYKPLLMSLYLTQMCEILTNYCKKLSRKGCLQGIIEKHLTKQNSKLYSKLFSASASCYEVNSNYSGNKIPKTCCNRYNRISSLPIKIWKTLIFLVVVGHIDSKLFKIRSVASWSPLKKTGRERGLQSTFGMTVFWKC